MTVAEKKPTKFSAVSLVERDGKVLAVWHKKYAGWVLPGGKVEHRETIAEAQARELLEETGLETVKRTLIYDALSSVQSDDSYLRRVHVFRVEAKGEPREIEEGHPVKWVTRELLVVESPFRVFFVDLFKALAAGTRCLGPLQPAVPSHDRSVAVVSSASDPITTNREDRHWVDATPDAEYPIRILQAHLDDNSGSTASDNLLGLPPTSALCLAMNAAAAERAEILRRAIELLRSVAAAS